VGENWGGDIMKTSRLPAHVAALSKTAEQAPELDFNLRFAADRLDTARTVISFVGREGVDLLAPENSPLLEEHRSGNIPTTEPGLELIVYVVAPPGHGPHAIVKELRDGQVRFLDVGTLPDHNVDRFGGPDSN
jgi:hypothetical protein